MVNSWLAKAPTAVVVAAIVVCGVVALGILGSFVALTAVGADTAEFRMWINTLGQILVYPLLGLNTIASIQSARSASRAEDQTNGHLADREAQIARLTAQLAALRNQTGKAR